LNSKANSAVVIAVVEETMINVDPVVSAALVAVAVAAEPRAVAVALAVEVVVTTMETITSASPFAFKIRRTEPF
jgi:hypothetical protein